MCGIVGIEFSSSASYLNILDWIDKTLTISSRRGKDSSGISFFINHNNENILYSLRSENSADKLIHNQNFKKLIFKYTQKYNKIKYIIAHTRLATNGSTINKNNQPIINKKNCNALVFNGIITNFDKIKKKFKLNHITKNDGLALSILDKSTKFQNLLEGSFSFLKLSLNKRRPCFQYATNNGSLYMAINTNKDIKKIFMSEESFFKLLKIKGYFQVKKNKIFTIPLKKKLKNKLITKNILQTNNQVKVFEIKRPIIHTKIKKKIQARLDYFNETIVRCKNCILPNTHPFINFDDNGICNFCKNEKILELKNKKILFNKLHDIKNKYGENKILLAFSGGRDSSFALHLLVKKLKIRPITYTYDWGLNTDLARRNVAIMTGNLGVENIVIAADLRKKREYVEKNIRAWLKKPHLGIVPLFMAGDKQFMSNASLLKKELNTKIELFAANLHEVTQFKEEFSGIKMWPDSNINTKYGEGMGLAPQVKMMLFYSYQFLSNPSYLNSSLFDTLKGFLNYYYAGVYKYQIFEYFDWNEDIINNVLINKYGWETAKDTTTTWRIGDGSAAFYNLIYLLFAGFTENDVIRSNLIRQKKLDRARAINLIISENKIRYETLDWYLKLFNFEINNFLSNLVEKASNYEL